MTQKDRTGSKRSDCADNNQVAEKESSERPSVNNPGRGKGRGGGVGRRDGSGGGKGRGGGGFGGRRR